MSRHLSFSQTLENTNMHCVVNLNGPFCACINQGGVWLRPLLPMPCKHWCTRSTTYQQSLVHWGPSCYYTHRKHLQKSVLSHTWHTWTLQHWQVLCNAEGCILLAKHEVWPRKVIHSLMQRMPAQQVSNKKGTQAPAYTTSTRQIGQKCGAGFHFPPAYQ